MAKTISELKAQSAEVKNASAIGENTATRVGQLFGDIVEHVEQYENTKDGKDASQDAQMQSLVSAEESRAKGEERGLQNQIHAEKIDRQTADTYLGNLIQQESSARETADENIRTALANETARAQAAEQELAAAQIYTNKIKDGAVTTPKIADGAVTYEKTDIIAQELGTNMTKVPSQKVVTDAIQKEETERKADINGLAAALASETIQREQGDENLNAAIEAEKDRAEAREQELTVAIQQEITRATAAEEANAQAIEEEKAAMMGTDRIADGAVTTPKIADGAVTYEKTDIIAQELGTNMTKVPSQKVVTDAIQKEETERKADINGLAAALASETIQREQGDENLNAAIEAEKDRAEAAEESNTQAIAKEKAEIIDIRNTAAISLDGTEADLGISDEQGNIIAEFGNGHIRTKDFDSSDIKSDIESNTQAIAKEKAEIIDIRNTAAISLDGTEADLGISDEQGNIIAEFGNGHIRTKYFNSSDVSNDNIISISQNNYETTLVEATQTFSGSGWSSSGFTITDKAVSSESGAILSSTKQFGQDRRRITWMFKTSSALTVIKIGTNFDNSFASELRLNFPNNEIEVFQKRTNQITKTIPFAFEVNKIYSLEIYVDGRTFTLRILKQVANKSAKVLEQVFEEYIPNPNFGYTSYPQWGYKYGSWKGSSYLSLSVGQIEVLSYRHALLHKKNPYIYIIGDSISEGMACQDYEKYGEILRRQFGIDNVSLSGVGSETTSRVATRFTNEIKFIKPKYAVIYLGTNQENSDGFRTRYSNMVTSLTAIGAIVIVCTIPSAPALTAIVREIAEEQGAHVCDFDFLYQHKTEYYTCYDMVGNQYNDNIHPNGIGQNLMATKICETILSIEQNL